MITTTDSIKCQKFNTIIKDPYITMCKYFKSGLGTGTYNSYCINCIYFHR